MGESLNYSFKEFEGFKVLDLKGNLAVDNIAFFEKTVKKICDKENLIINFENVLFVSSSGLTALVDVSQFARENENRIILVWANGDISRLVEITDNYNFLIFAESLEEAVTKIHFYT